MQEKPNVKYKSRDTKVVIRNRQSKDRQHNDQTKTTKRQVMVNKNTTKKTTD